MINAMNRQPARDDGISEKEAYKKYGLKVFQTTNAQSSIRTRVMDVALAKKSSLFKYMVFNS